MVTVPPIKFGYEDREFFGEFGNQQIQMLLVVVQSQWMSPIVAIGDRPECLGRVALRAV